MKSKHYPEAAHTEPLSNKPSQAELEARKTLSSSQTLVAMVIVSLLCILLVLIMRHGSDETMLVTSNIYIVECNV